MEEVISQDYSNMTATTTTIGAAEEGEEEAEGVHTEVDYGGKTEEEEEGKARTGISFEWPAGSLL